MSSVLSAFIVPAADYQMDKIIIIFMLILHILIIKVCVWS